MRALKAGGLTGKIGGKAKARKLAQMRTMYGLSPEPGGDGGDGGGCVKPSSPYRPSPALSSQSMRAQLHSDDQSVHLGEMVMLELFWLWCQLSQLS
jgi:hypothetical protein